MGPVRGETIMDTKKTLVIGQAVLVGKGTSIQCAGKVVEVTPEGVDVQIGNKVVRFDHNDKRGGQFECTPMLDAKTAVVGQAVDLTSAVYYCAGKVVKVTPDGVVVQKDMAYRQGPLELIMKEYDPSLNQEELNGNVLLYFDNNGRSYLPELPSSRDSTAPPPISPWVWDGNGTFEGGPWYITAIKK